jgi:hypothetical protein
VLIFYPALVVVEILRILQFFTFKKLQNISAHNAATWRQKMAADFSSLVNVIIHIHPSHDKAYNPMMT